MALVRDGAGTAVPMHEGGYSETQEFSWHSGKFSAKKINSKFGKLMWPSHSSEGEVLGAGLGR